MKNSIIYSLVLISSLCRVSTVYATDKSNLLLMVPPLIAANGNGSSCRINTVTSAGQVWMDRNLGAFRVATSPTDSAAFGDLYQWGRLSDGHEKRNSPVIFATSPQDVPGHDKFLNPLPGDSSSFDIYQSYDWRIPQNNNLWQGVTGTNNPCPSGFRLPTATELDAERSSWSSNDAAGAFASPLKLVMAGSRCANGALLDLGSVGAYWSSTVTYMPDLPSEFELDGSYGKALAFLSSGAVILPGEIRSSGESVRCIKN